MDHVKPPTTYREQLNILAARGVIVEDEPVCEEILANINYYRLTAYLLPFKIADNQYAAGTSFIRVYRIYEFDRKLRNILFSALEEVEISLRARLSYYHAHKYGAVGYLEPSSFSPRHKHDSFKETFDREVRYNEKTPFVKHHIQHYGGLFPLWVASELFTFGMLSRFYADMKTPDQKYIARQFHTTDTNMRSWLRCCSDLRNICAHYGRLYYRVFTAIPAGYDDQYRRAALSRLWGALLALRGLFLNAEKWNAEVISPMSALFEEYAGDVDLYHIAFPSDWENLLRK